MGILKWVGMISGAGAAVAAAPFTGGASLGVLAAAIGGATVGAAAGSAAGTVIDHTPVGSLANSLVDNVFRETVEPVVGSILHCSLFGVEHTGVYVGAGEIVELLGTGSIRATSRSGFVDGTNAITVYIACDDELPIGSLAVAERAKRKIGTARDYNLLLDNCHQFTVGCITGNFENPCNYFWMVESEISSTLNAGRSVTWRAWTLPNT